MEECKGCDTPFCIVFHLERTIRGPLGQEFENSTLYRSNVRGLQYLILTMPDIAHLIHKLVKLPTPILW